MASDALIAVALESLAGMRHAQRCGPARAGASWPLCVLRRRPRMVGLGIGCDNTAKWLHEHDRGNVEFAPGQLVIIDEATLADTGTLDRLTGLAVTAGAKVLLVGDDAQLQSVDAGGAFSMLAEARGSDVPELTEIHRFTQECEKQATAGLRKGVVDVVGTYARHRRLQDTTDQMLDTAYAAWRDDTRRCQRIGEGPRRSLPR